MFADAIGDSISTSERRSVDIHYCKWSDKSTGLRYVYLTPLKVAQHILDFDAGDKGRIKPFKIILKGGQIFPLESLTEDQLEDKRIYNKKIREGKLIVKKVNGQGREDVVGIIGGQTPRRVPGGTKRVFGRKGLVQQ